MEDLIVVTYKNQYSAVDNMRVFLSHVERHFGKSP